MTKTPIAYWSLDETGGTTAHDVIGGYDGALINPSGPQWDANGKVHGCLAIDGATFGQYVNVPTAPTGAGAGSFSIAVWVKTVKSIVGTQYYFVSRGVWAANQGWFIGAGDFNEDGTPCIAFKCEGAGSHAVGAFDVNDGNWHLIVGVMDADLHESFIYADRGVLIGQGVQGLYQEPSNAMRFGSMQGLSETYNGRVDEVKYFSRAVSQDEVIEVFDFANNVLLDPKSAPIGAAPLIRVRFDLDGSGTFKTVEHEEVMSVGNVSRAIEYFTNKTSFGDATFSLRNNDLRWSDNNVNALSYFFPTEPERYHMKMALVEVGFDGPDKDTSWKTIFSGYIIEKNEDAENRQADFSLMDEWTKLLNFELAPIKTGSEIFQYYGDTTGTLDKRALQLGVYYGPQRFLPLEYKEKDKQLLIPCAANIAGATTWNGITAQYRDIRLLNYGDLAETAGAATAQDLYFWDWSNPVPQWTKIDRANYTRVFDSVDASIHYVLNTDTPGLYGGQTLAQYWDKSNTNCDPIIGLQHTALEYNPAKILLHLFRSIMMAPGDWYKIDFSDLWLQGDFDFSDPNYYSFDTSAYYLDQMNVRICVRANKNKTTASSLMDDLAKLTRGAFFVDGGKPAIGFPGPTRQIKFVIHQPRPFTPTILSLPEDRLHGPALKRSTDRVINSVSVCNYPYTVSDKYDDVQTSTTKSDDSITAYGERIESIANKPGDNVFLYGNAEYAAFLAQNYVMVYSEPPMELDFQTDLIGLNYDLKSLIRVQEKSALGLDPLGTTMKDVFEIYSLALDSANFMMTFTAFWAGYLLMPYGDTGKRWAFASDDAVVNAYASDTVGPDGLEYYAW